MPRKRYTSEPIIVHLREAEVELAKGQATPPKQDQQAALELSMERPQNRSPLQCR